MDLAVPVVEVAGHRDGGGVRGPDREAHALPALLLDQVRAQARVEPRVLALPEEVDVEIGDGWRRAEVRPFVQSRLGPDFMILFSIVCSGHEAVSP